MRWAISLRLSLPTGDTGISMRTAARSLEPDPRLTVIGLRSSDDAQRAARQLLELILLIRPTLAARNLLSVGAFRALAQVGKEREVALVGFDDFPLADLLSPGLWWFVRMSHWIGTTVAEMLFARIDGDNSPPQHVVFEPSLVSRGSGRSVRPVTLGAAATPTDDATQGSDGTSACSICDDASRYRPGVP